FEKTQKELQEQLGSFQKDARDRSVKSVLEARGVSPKVAAFIPADKSSAEDITAWLEEFGDVFGATASQNTATDDDGPDGDEPVLDNDLAAVLAKIQGADSGAGAVNVDSETQAAAGLASLAANSKTAEQFFAGLAGLRR
ncbi:hypothetical protein AB0941_43005, partial [Streptomyces sp. NPDC013433]